MPEGAWYAMGAGGEELAEFYEYAGIYVYNMRPALLDMKEWIQHTIEMQFETEGAYRSGGWQPLSEDYEIWKRTHAPGRPILVLTGAMQAIVESDDAWAVGIQYAEYLPESELAGWHQEGVPDRRTRGWQPRNDRGQFGTKRTAANPLPARPMLDLDELDLEELEDRIWKWLDELRMAPGRTWWGG